MSRQVVASDARRTTLQWRLRLERAGLAPGEVEPNKPALVVRGAELEPHTIGEYR